jgi:hypothetical protein
MVVKLGLTLREEQIQVVWEQGAEENIWSKREEMAGEWRRLHNEELDNLYALTSNQGGWDKLGR